MVKNIARWIVMIPMCVGWVIGFVLSPLLTGFIAGSNSCEALIDRIDER